MTFEYFCVYLNCCINRVLYMQHLGAWCYPSLIYTILYLIIYRKKTYFNIRKY